MATLQEMLYGSTSSSSGGGTRGTLGSEGLYRRPAASNQGLAGTGVGTVADGLAYGRTVTPQGLVENRLNNLTAANSPYINQHRTAAQRYAASRGLQNSAYAGAAGIEAAIKSGLPIAQADAAAINEAASQTQGVLTQNQMQERALVNEATIAEANRASAADAYRAGQREAAEDRAFQLQMQRESLGFEGEQRGLDRVHQRDMTGFEYSLRDNMADNDAFRTDWLSNNDFNRSQYSDMVAHRRGLETMGYAAEIQSAQDFTRMLDEYALNNPDVFNAEDYTRFRTFTAQSRTQGFQDIMRRYFRRG